MSTTTERQIVRGDADRGTAPVAATKKIPGGTLVFADSNGYATDVAGGNKFLGVADDTADNTGGANGDVSCEYFRQGQFEFPLASVAQADLGVKAYASDNDTLTKTPTSNSLVGTISEVLTDKVMVDLDPQAA